MTRCRAFRSRCRAMRSRPVGRWRDYLESYADHHRLPIEPGVRVDRLRARSEAGGADGYTISAGDRRYEANQVIVATGAFQRPYVPDLASRLDPGIRQLHAADYRGPHQLAEGPVLVVGLSHSGADLAYEVANAGHRDLRVRQGAWSTAVLRRQPTGTARLAGDAVHGLERPDAGHAHRPEDGAEGARRRWSAAPRPSRRSHGGRGHAA